MSKKKYQIEIKEDSEYLEFLKKYAEKRELSITASIKQILFSSIDNMNIATTITQEHSQVKVEENKKIDTEKNKPRRNLAKNSKFIKR